MNDNRISATLSQTDRDEILVAIKTIREKMPFLISLSAEESKSLAQIGDKRRAFVAAALALAEHNQNFLPRSFEVEEMRKDVELFNALESILLPLTQLTELIDGTVKVAGSEAYASALAVYQYAKAGGVAEGLESAVDDLGKRFARKTKAPADAPKA